MMLPEFQDLAQIAVARVLNCVPEGILIAALAWLLLRVLPGQNPRTRFAVWLLALASVAGLPFVGTRGFAHSAAAGDTSSLLTLSPHWAFALFVAWMLAGFVAMSRLAIGILRLRALRQSCKPINPASLHPALADTARAFLRSHSVMLASSDQLSVPSAVGFLRPMIVIPEWALNELSPEEFKIILLHEMAHLRRRDDWTNLLQKAVRALYIFHPAVWWIERQLSREREMACDDQVLAETGNPRGYAKCLVALLERSFARRAWAMAQAAVHRADEARERLSRILDTNRIGGKGFGKPAVGLAGVVSLLCFVVVPHVPEIVGFAPSATDARLASAPMIENSKFPLAPVVPAAMHTRESESRRSTAEGNQVSAPHLSEARASAKAIAPHVVKAKAVHHAAPDETVLVIRTTEQIGPDAWISRVTILRLTWVPSRAASVPVAKTT